MELADTLKEIFIETAKTLKGSDRRRFMAEVVKALGQGGQRQAETELGWHRRTIRKGQHELESGLRGYDNFAARGCKPAEHHLPNLLDDLKAIVEAESQTDPTFKTTRLYIRLSAAEVRKQWKMLVEIVRSLVVAYVLARFVVLLGVVEWMSAVQLGVCMWIGFPITLLVGSVIWENIPWKLAGIHAGDWLVKILCIVVILGVWR